MLLNGLGEVISRSVPSSAGFADLFTGSGAVACHVGENFDVPVKAFDLQSFAVALADGVVGRDKPVTDPGWLEQWLDAGLAAASSSTIWEDACEIQNALSLVNLPEQVTEARSLAADSEFGFCRAYGGYYFSPRQATLMGALRANLPEDKPHRKLALAALIATASNCAAAPGHTAQPFSPTATAGPFLVEAWKRVPADVLKSKVGALASRHAVRSGKSEVCEASEAAGTLSDGWLAFVDPPYSSVHYSRFYHVLESLSRGEVGDVTGAGRYPSAEDRPASDYSITTRAKAAFENLFTQLSAVGAKVIVTFPANGASNGITGSALREMAAVDFRIVEEKVSSRFSTMGGNSSHREARQDAVELILSLSPR